MNWLNESDQLGYSASLIHRNFCNGCGNLIVGAVSWIETLGTFELSIARLKEDGTAHSFWSFKQESEESKDDAPYIDHMHLDSSTGEDWLFGTTRSRNREWSGYWVYIWKVQLDSDTHDPIPNSVTCMWVDDILKGDGYVTGLRP